MPIWTPDTLHICCGCPQYSEIPILAHKHPLIHGDKHWYTQLPKHKINELFISLEECLMIVSNSFSQVELADISRIVLCVCNSIDRMPDNKIRSVFLHCQKLMRMPRAANGHKNPSHHTDRLT